MTFRPTRVVNKERSDLRDNAVESDLFGLPNISTIKSPSNIVEEAMLSYGAPAGVGNGQTYFHKLKWDKRYDFPIMSMTASIGTNGDGVSRTFGLALYTANVDSDGVARLRLIKGKMAAAAPAAYPACGLTWDDGYMLDRKKDYVTAVYIEAAVVNDSVYYIQDVNVSTMMAAVPALISDAGGAWPTVVVPTPNGSRTFFSNKLIWVNAGRLTRSTTGSNASLVNFY